MEITENQMFFVFLFFVTIIVLFKCFESREDFSNLENLDYMFYRPPTDCNLNGSCKQCGDDKPKQEQKVQQQHHSWV